MRSIVACCAVLSLCACSIPETSSTASIPVQVGNGIGSQYGNYGAEMDGEMLGSQGERCIIFNWDRPVTKDLAIRLRSASCEAKERPGWMISREISRTLIPMSESNLKTEPD